MPTEHMYTFYDGHSGMKNRKYGIAKIGSIPRLGFQFRYG